MICWTVRLPSQRSTISRLGPFRRRARSGMSNTRCWLFSPRRHPGASRGRLLSSGGIVSPSRFLGRLEGTGGRPAGIYIRKIEGVELSPEDVALGTQRGVRSVLLRARLRVLYNPNERKLRVFRRLRQTASEIIEVAGKPGIVLAHAIHAQGNQLV